MNVAPASDHGASIATLEEAQAEYSRWWNVGDTSPSEEARRLLRANIESSEPSATSLYWRAREVLDGASITQDAARVTNGSNLMREAARLGSRAARSQLAFNDLQEAVLIGDREGAVRAAEALGELMQEDEVNATRLLATLYSGESAGLTMDLSKAEALYRKADELGYARGLRELALVLAADGKSVKAIEYMRAGAARGDPDAHVELSRWLLAMGDVAGAEREARRAVEHERIEGVKQLLSVLDARRGDDGVREEAVRLLQLWSKRSQSMKFALARELIYGPSHDVVKGHELLQELAEMGSGPALYELAIGGMLGVWVQDSQKSLEYLQEAARSGVPEAVALSELLPHGERDDLSNRPSGGVPQLE